MAKNPWFAMDCRVHTHPKTAALAEALNIDIDRTVGKLGRLWAWAKIGGIEDGVIGKIPASEIAAIMRWTKSPEKLVAALTETGFLDRGENGGFIIHDWYELNGKSTEKARKDRERKQ